MKYISNDHYPSNTQYNCASIREKKDNVNTCFNVYATSTYLYLMIDFLKKNKKKIK